MESEHLVCCTFKYNITYFVCFLNRVISLYDFDLCRIIQFVVKFFPIILSRLALNTMLLLFQCLTVNQSWGEQVVSSLFLPTFKMLQSHILSYKDSFQPLLIISLPLLMYLFVWQDMSPHFPLLSKAICESYTVWRTNHHIAEDKSCIIVMLNVGENKDCE